ncbi:Signal transduction histidine kinase regulating citrate/malate metabolism [Sulfitobacter noctilucae]|nr:Signal transduction histidine kinase regulating citrate/malate metabolism [Sulfitobacter noctilucae]
MGVIILISSLAAGIGMYYLQVYGFYEAVATEDVQLVSLTSDQPETIVFDNFQAIDAESSPIRYRACFTTSQSLAFLTENYVLVDNVDPRNAPDWFECFDASEIGAELEAGTALTFMGAKNVDFGVDRIVAITEDGRGYVWHELNDCGDKAYDGTIVGEECPRRPAEATE